MIDVPRPDLSPAMLKSFLQIRANYLAMAGGYAKASASGVRAAKEQLRLSAGVSRADFALAWTGQLIAPEPRALLWSALGIDPQLLDIRLTHGGQERLPPPSKEQP